MNVKRFIEQRIGATEIGAKAHFTLAMNSLSNGDMDLALKEYQIVKEQDEVLASELYDQIFS
ncbi:MAG: hypothetical protein U9Q07_06520 [Planctomycetota bacterium]|nr:hypothetical protein [Planctomycetota bacterium]